MFHNHPRYDCVIIQTVDKIIFGQLIYVFSCSIQGADELYPTALIHPFVTPTGARRQSDSDFGLIQLRKAPPTSSEIFSVRSIIRGALVVEDSKRPGDVLVVDIIDADMFLRLKGLAL